MAPESMPLWADWVRWAVEVLTPIAAIALVIATLLLVNKTRIVAVKTAELVEKTKEVAHRTAELVKETIRGTDQLDRHHQEALLPMVYVDAELKFSRMNKDGQDGMLVSLTGFLINVGAGPSTSVNLLVSPIGIQPRSFYQGLIGANDRQQLREVEWFLPRLQQNQGFYPFEVTTKYQTLFDTTGHTIQRSHSGMAKDVLVIDSEKPTIRPRRLQEGALSVAATAVVAPPPT